MLLAVKRFLRNKLVADVLWLSISKLCVLFTGLIGLRILTELASPEIFGEANLIIGVLGLGLHFCGAPFLQSVLRLYPKVYNTSEESLFLKLILKNLSFSVLILAFIIFIMLKIGVLDGVPSASYGLYFLIIGYLFGTALKGVFQGVLNSLRYQKMYSLWHAVEAVLMLLFACLLLWRQPTVQSYIGGHTLAILLTLCVAVFAIKRQSILPDSFFIIPTRKNDFGEREVEIKSKLWRDIYVFGSPFIAFALLGWMTSMFDRYYLASQFSFYEVGKYVAVFSIASRLPMLPANILNEAFRPIIYKAAADTDWDKWNKATFPWVGALLLSGLFIVLCVSVFGAFIATILLAEEYRLGTTSLMVVLTGSFVLLSLTQAVELMVLSFENSSKILLSKTLGALGTVALCFLLIPSHGFIGAGYASLGGQVILLLSTVGTLLFYKRLISQ